MDGGLAFVTISSAGTVEKPRLNVELSSDKPLFPKDKKIIEDTIRSIFNLDLDLTQFYQDVKHDSVFYGLSKSYAFEEFVNSNRL